MSFSPVLSVLPLAQQALWPCLKPVARLGLVLYGGTAIALRLGHRVSVDFDFFSDQPLDRSTLREALPVLRHAPMLQDLPNAWTLSVPSGEHKEDVKLSFFGTLDFGRVGLPDWTRDGVLQVASLNDLMATKLKVIMQRCEVKDYQDLAAMIEAGVDLSVGLASARALFGAAFQPTEALKALVYFKGGDVETLTAAEKNRLINASRSVDRLPSVAVLSSSLAAPFPWAALPRSHGP